MKILYVFRKWGYEAEYWNREIEEASDDRFTYIPFNYNSYLERKLYDRAQLLDNLYYQKNEGLLKLYEDFEAALDGHHPEAMIVDNGLPFHPDYLRTIPIYKVLRSPEGSTKTYDLDFPFLHAYDHVLYFSPAYSRDMGMEDKYRYCGATNVDFWPLALFDAGFDTTKTEETILQGERDVDSIFIGTPHWEKIEFLAGVKKTLGSKCCMYGLCSFKRNIYWNLKFGFPGWFRALPFVDYVPTYQRSKIGINVHLRGGYTLGNYRLFDLPGNGLMQLSDGGDELNHFFEVGEEIISYEGLDDLVDKVRYYLAHDEERERIALNGFRRVLKDHRFKQRMRQAGELIEKGMERIGY